MLERIAELEKRLAKRDEEIIELMQENGRLKKEVEDLRGRLKSWINDWDP